MSAPRGGRAESPLRLVATCAPGLEPILEGELSVLGFAGIEPGHSAVSFAGGWPEVWRANYWLRTANRVLVEVASFAATTSEELYDGVASLLGVDPRSLRGSGPTPKAGETMPGRPGPARDRDDRETLGAGRRPLPEASRGDARGGARTRTYRAGTASELRLDGVALSDLLAPNRTFAVSATTSRSRLNDTRWVALKVKDAIADAQRKRFGRRADVDPRRPDLPLRVWLHADRATVLLDSSREPLDRRGYRKVSGAAPLREQLAAALVLASGWEARGPVVDPMCGTGTLLIEAAFIALGRAPGALRESWVFERWPGFDPYAFARLRAGSGSKARERDPAGDGNRAEEPRSPLRLYGRDTSSDAIRAARANLEAAGVAVFADLAVADGFAFQPPASAGLIVVNPAYGERLETTDQEWARLGDLFKQRYTGWHAAVIAGTPSFGKHLGLRPRQRIPVKNGPIDAKILIFDLYSGKAHAAPAADPDA